VGLLLAAWLAGACRNREVAFPVGLEPLESNTAPWPQGSTSDPYPEELSMVAGEDDWLWAHARGYVKAPLTTVWEALRDLDVDVDRRRVDDYSWTWDVPQDYDYCYRIHVVVEDIVTVEWDLDWNHGAVNGTTEDPEAVGVRFFKSDGSSFIDMQIGSISAYKLEDDITAIELIEHLDASMTEESDVTGYLQDLYTDVVAYSHGEPLPSY